MFPGRSGRTPRTVPDDRACPPRAMKPSGSRTVLGAFLFSGICPEALEGTAHASFPHCRPGHGGLDHLLRVARLPPRPAPPPPPAARAGGVHALGAGDDEPQPGGPGPVLTSAPGPRGVAFREGRPVN